MKRINTYGFFLFFVLAFISILYKVIQIPITHDEIKTVMFYYDFSVWEIMMFPDNIPNNHILNTLTAKFFINLFGKDVWVIRIPSLLSFIIYAFAVYRLLKSYFKPNSIFILGIILLFTTNAFFLDFYSLCRGYGMAAAFSTLSISYLISGYKTTNENHIWKAVVWSIFSCYANFTTLPFWAATTILASLFLLITNTDNLKRFFIKLSQLALISFMYLALIATPLIKMSSTKQFKFWSSNGFYDDTVMSLVENWISRDKMLDVLTIKGYGILFTLLFIFSGIMFGYHYFKHKDIKKTLTQPLSIAFLILGLTIFVNVCQTLLLKTPNLIGRTAIFFYPMFIIVVIGLLSKLDNLKSYWLKVSVTLFIVVFSLFHINNTFTPNTVREWWYETNNLEVIDYINSLDQEEDIILKTHWMFNPSFFYYYKKGDLNQNITLENGFSHEFNKDFKANYYYIFESEKELLPNFEVVKSFGYSFLMRKKK